MRKTLASLVVVLVFLSSATATAGIVRVHHASCTLAGIGHRTPSGTFLCRSAAEFCRAYKASVGGQWLPCQKALQVESACRNRFQLIVLAESERGESDLRLQCRRGQAPRVLDGSPEIDERHRPNYQAGCCQAPN